LQISGGRILRKDIIEFIRKVVEIVDLQFVGSIIRGKRNARKS
jgi:hypothetical protein